MKAALVVGVAVLLFAAVAIVTSSASAAGQAGYTCRYKLSGGLFLVMSGRDNGPELCRTMARGLGGKRVAKLPARVSCTWEHPYYDMRVSFASRDRFDARLFCSMMADTPTLSEWIRVR